ncbi:chaperonin 10-like protein [Lipomyces doorenjongii]
MCASKIRAQVLYGPKDLKLVVRDIDAPAKDEVQVAIKSTTLCGTDLHYFTHYANGDIRIMEPLTQGHEATGIVVEVGPDVSTLKVGDRVAIEAGVPCAACEHCLAGRYNVCPKIKFRSSAASIPHFQGTLQDRINHPAQWCHKLPENLSYDEGALLEPLSVAIHSVRKANIRPKSRCLITGAGAIGLLCSAVAKSYGCEQVVMTDIASNRLEFARNNGFAEEVHTIIPNRGADVQEDLSIAQDLAEDLLALGGEPVLSRGGFDAVFECTGAESCVRVGVYAARPSSSVLLVGMGTPIQTLPM